MSDSGDSGLADSSPFRRYEIDRKQDTPWPEGETVGQDDEKSTFGQCFQVHVVDVVNRESA